MRYIKEFENISKEPQIGDYVFCSEQVGNKLDDLDIFLENNIGQIVSIEDRYIKPTKVKECSYFVKYDNIPDNVKDVFSFYDDCRIMVLEEIKFYSSNREEVELKIMANKYNL